MRSNASLRAFSGVVKLEALSILSSSWLVANLPTSLRELQLLAYSGCDDVENGPFLFGKKIQLLVAGLVQAYPDLKKLHITVEINQNTTFEPSIDNWTVIAFCLATMWDSIAVQFTLRCSKSALKGRWSIVLISN
jgi:hypothetical protein